jgi:hypothetical protein
MLNTTIFYKKTAVGWLANVDLLQENLSVNRSAAILIKNSKKDLGLLFGY